MGQCDSYMFWVSVIHICSCMLVARPITNFVTGVLYVLPELIPKSCFVFTVLLHSKFQTLSWSEIDLIKISCFTESKCRIVLTDSTIGHCLVESISTVNDTLIMFHEPS
jgi:hypothetical protein